MDQYSYSQPRNQPVKVGGSNPCFTSRWGFEGHNWLGHSRCSAQLQEKKSFISNTSNVTTTSLEFK